MPAVFLDRLPLPSLQAYTIGSVLLLACSVHYAIQVTSEFGLKLNATVGENSDNGVVYRNSTIGIPSELSVSEFMYDQVFIRKAVEVMYFMMQEPLCIWTLINMAYCCLILVGKVIQKLVFGDLRVSEQQHIKDKFWNFVFYKFIFIFGVMNVQFMDEVVLWCSWFSVLGFLHLLAQLCKDRCEYLSFSPTTPKWTHCRLLTLLLSILLISCGLFGICVFIGLHAGINTFAFMAAECSLVTVKTVYVILRYAVYLWDVTHEGVWERRASYVYYSELIFELTALTIDFLHHLHMLVWGNIFLSMASLVIAMQLRCLFYEIQHRIKKYKNYLRIVKHMEFNYPMATISELEKNNDDCAICWDHMDAARKLPCGHLFHNSCLRSWLEQDTSCPTCRKTLNDTVDKDMNADINRNNHSDILGSLGGVDDAPAHPVNQTTNHFFHFDGSRYVSWLPSFSVEVSHSSLLGDRQFEAVQTSQLDNMARQVQQMFPNMPFSVIMDDLRSTRSVEVTIENILDEKLVPPPSVLFQGNRSQLPLDQSNQASGSSQTSLPLEKRQEMVRRTFNHLGYLEDAVFSPESDSSDTQENNSFPETPSTPFIPMTPALGCRFSKSSEERERILASRKEDLIKMARRKYMTKLHKRGSSDFEEAKRLSSRLTREQVQSPYDFPEERLMLSKHQIDNLMT